MPERLLEPVLVRSVVGVSFANPPITWPEPDPVLEAEGARTPAGRQQAASRAAKDVEASFRDAEKDAAAKLTKRLRTLQTSLRNRLLGDTAGLTDFKRFTLQSLVADVDRLIADTAAGAVADTRPAYMSAVDLGANAAENPLAAAKLNVNLAAGLPGLDSVLVQAAFDNTADLLTAPMQQFRNDVVTNLRRVALAGDGRQSAINQLRDTIQGQGFDNAAFRAERIVRTELGRVFNQATFERLTQLGAEFPFLRKCWRASLDGRTRQGHREAGRVYGRGQGIPVASLFVLNVYQEATGRGSAGKGSVGKKIGQVTLRFPVDPQAQPAGALAARATIMCRCNAFVDFDMKAFAEYTRSQVQVALRDVPRPAPAPAPPPPAAPDNTFRSLGQSLRNTFNFRGGVFQLSHPDALRLARQIPGAVAVRAGKYYVVEKAGMRFGPDGFVPHVPKVKAVRVPKPQPAAGLKPAAVPAPAQAGGPTGTKVSDAMQFRTGPATTKYYGGALNAKIKAQVQKGFAEIDKVHGDGPLPKIPVATVASRHRSRAAAYYMNSGGGDAIELGFGSKLMTNQPYIGVFHETGHFLDHQGIGRRGFATEGTRAHLTADQNRAMDRLMDSLKNSRVIQTLKNWNQANIPGSGFASGDGVIPSNIHRPMVNYLLLSKETFARAYAQYVATKSTNQAVKSELRNLQAQSKQAVEGVKPGTPMNPHSLGQAPLPGTWDYPWAWQDEDFAPIEAAFDELFGALGWRSK